MTPQEFKQIRIDMKLTQSQMAAWLYLSDGRVIRNWESGKYQIPGSVIKCLELFRAKDPEKEALIAALQSIIKHVQEGYFSSEIIKEIAEAALKSARGE